MANRPVKRTKVIEFDLWSFMYKYVYDSFMTQTKFEHILKLGILTKSTQYVPNHCKTMLKISYSSSTWSKARLSLAEELNKPNYNKFISSKYLTNQT